jgi:hypothetical protein
VAELPTVQQGKVLSATLQLRSCSTSPEQSGPHLCGSSEAGGHNVSFPVLFLARLQGQQEQTGKEGLTPLTGLPVRQALP